MVKTVLVSMVCVATLGAFETNAMENPGHGENSEHGEKVPASVAVSAENGSNKPRGILWNIWDSKPLKAFRNFECGRDFWLLGGMQVATTGVLVGALTLLTHVAEEPLWRYPLSFGRCLLDCSKETISCFFGGGGYREFLQDPDGLMLDLLYLLKGSPPYTSLTTLQIFCDTSNAAMLLTPMLSIQK